MGILESNLRLSPLGGPYARFWVVWSLTALLSTVAPAYGEWVEIGANAKFTVYMDDGTIRRKGDIVRVWILHDYKTARTIVGGTFLSLTQQQEYNCSEEESRLITYTSYAGSMASGDVVYTDSPKQSKWEPIPPDTAGKRLLDFACTKK